MQRRQIITSAAVAASLASLAPQLKAQLSPATPRMALLVGNSNYKNGTQLEGPRNDVALMAKTLVKGGFAVQQMLDASDAQFRAGVEDFASKVAANRALPLVYLAGHGQTAKNTTRFVGVSDEPLTNVDALFRHSTDLAWVIDKLRNATGSGSSARVPESQRIPVILIADIATTDDLNSSSRKRGESNLGSIGNALDSVVMMASIPGTVARENASTKHGDYTENLAAVLQTSGLDIEEVDRAVRAAVRQKTNGEQIPWSNMSQTSSIVLIPSASAVSIPRPPLRDDPKARGRGARGG